MNSNLEKPIVHVLFYLLGFCLLLLTIKFSPTTLAGPGLDFVLMVIMFLSIIYFLVIVWFKLKVTLLQKIFISIIHLIGVSTIWLFINLPT